MQERKKEWAQKESAVHVRCQGLSGASGSVANCLPVAVAAYTLRTTGNRARRFVLEDRWGKRKGGGEGRVRVVLTPISRPMSAPVRKVFSPPTVGTLAASDCANGATSMEEKEKRKEKAYKSQYSLTETGAENACWTQSM